MPMTGRKESVPEPERRRAANAALRDSIEEVCRHYAPSGARVEDCWEVRGEAGAVTLRVFLAGPMQGSWTDAATGGRGDALDLVAYLRGLDGAGALAEAERFLDRNASRGGAGGRGRGRRPDGAVRRPCRRDGRRKRPARRSAKRRKAGASRRTAVPHEPPADAASSRPGGEPESSGDETGPSRNAAADPDGVSFTADDRQRIRKTAEDVAWLRSRHTVRSLDARAHERAKARNVRHGRRWRREVLQVINVLALAAAWLFVGVAAENRYGVAELVAAYGAELPEGRRCPAARWRRLRLPSMTPVAAPASMPPSMQLAASCAAPCGRRDGRWSPM